MELKKGNKHHLTKREIEILVLIGEGFNNKELAKRLFISLRTIEVHKNNIVKKLNLKSASELPHYVILHENNLIQNNKGKPLLTFYKVLDSI